MLRPSDKILWTFSQQWGPLWCGHISWRFIGECTLLNNICTTDVFMWGLFQQKVIFFVF